jgi:hypothetical protein
MVLLQKTKTNNLIINERYSLNEDAGDSTFWFIVLEEVDDFKVRIRYYDNTIGILYTHFTDDVFILPLSSLEKQLL